MTIFQMTRLHPLMYLRTPRPGWADEASAATWLVKVWLNAELLTKQNWRDASFSSRQSALRRRLPLVVVFGAALQSRTPVVFLVALVIRAVLIGRRRSAQRWFLAAVLVVVQLVTILQGGQA
jgi:hypothetical protein